MTNADRWLRGGLALLCLGSLPAGWLLYPVVVGERGATGPSVNRTGPTGCPFRTLTGKPCPLCGLTRAFCSAARGRFAQARGYHVNWWVAAAGVYVLGSLALHDALFARDTLGRVRNSVRAYEWSLLALLGVALLAIALAGG